MNLTVQTNLPTSNIIPPLSPIKIVANSPELTNTFSMIVDRERGLKAKQEQLMAEQKRLEEEKNNFWKMVADSPSGSQETLSQDSLTDSNDSSQDMDICDVGTQPEILYTSHTIHVPNRQKIEEEKFIYNYLDHNGICTKKDLKKHLNETVIMDPKVQKYFSDPMNVELIKRLLQTSYKMIGA